ncbi:MAG: DUF3149 domain-containing protein [Hydrogenophilus sp.]|nr:DUF3149 domain-containing protein [Hydrogenophilus sp.]
MSDALREFLTTDIGWLSIFTIGFVIVMAIYLYNFVRKNMNDRSDG